MEFKTVIILLIQDDENFGTANFYLSWKLEFEFSKVKFEKRWRIITLNMWS